MDTSGAEGPHLTRGAATPGSTDSADHCSSRSLRPHLVRSGAFLAVMGIFGACWLVGLTFSTLSALSQVGVRTIDLGPQADSTLSLVGIVGLVCFGGGWLLSLFIPVREFVDETSVLIEDASSRSTSTYGAIRTIVDKRCPPLKATQSDIDGTPTLRVTNGTEWALIIVQEVGPDLHVGWTMWRGRSTVGLLGSIFADMVNGSAGDDPRLMQASSASAMQALLHTAVQQVCD